jgi:hypothetical protein
LAHNDSSWKSQAEDEQKSVQVDHLRGKQDSCTREHLYENSATIYDFSAYFITNVANRNDSGSCKDPNEVACTQEANALLGFTQHVYLRLPVIDIIVVFCVWPILIPAKTTLANLLLAARAPFA